MGLHITIAVDYAVRAMIYIASFPEGTRVLRHDIARAESIPKSFTAKILKNLVDSGLLMSSRGIHGGYTLARSPCEINLLEIVEAVEGPISVTRCVPDPNGCEFSESCPAHDVWRNVQERLTEILMESNLRTLSPEKPVRRKP